LWLQRSGAVALPHFALLELARLDSRVDAHLDGLRIAGDAGWVVCESELGWKEAGELFTAGFIAWETGKQPRIETVLAAAVKAPAAASGAVSALGWLTLAKAQPAIMRLCSAANPVHRRIGIGAAAIHRHNPGNALTAAVSDADLHLRTRALKAAGELGRADLQPAMRMNFSARDPACAYWAARSFALRATEPALGVAALRQIAESCSTFANRAAAMAVRRMEPAAARAWYRKLPMKLPHARSAIVAAGAVGDPEAIPWLMEFMKQLPLARLAGEAFSTITGTDLAYLDLDVKPPKDFDAGPTNDPKDENVEMDPDGNLPWPNPVAIQKWWNERRGTFPQGVRHLCGKPMTPESLQHVLRYGYQRQRAAAAIELAIRNPGQPLFEVRARGDRQMELLGMKKQIRRSRREERLNS
jgi:uncharacterized protein (TIGR02270 family)